MDFEQAERHFRELQKQLRSGRLNEENFRVEVAKLLLRDDRGVFWMLDADGGTWFCNQGEGWVAGDPYAQPPVGAARPAGRKAKRRRLTRLLALGVALLVFLGLVGWGILRQRPEAIWHSTQPTPTQSTRVQVTIASPADGSQVAVGQAVAIESTVAAAPDLGAVARVELQINGQTVDMQPVQPKVQPGQSSLPLSQPWRPTAVGEYQATVMAYSDTGDPLGAATITLKVVEAPDEVLPEPACSLDAAFVADVTIPPGTAFPPGARMDKVWQVRNNGSCAWGVGYELARLQGEGLGAPDMAPVPPAAAGETADLAVTFWAPVRAGAYTSVWQLRSPDGEFFGPTLTLSITVQSLAEEDVPPIAPARVQAAVMEDGHTVRLTWKDRSDNEDAFRVYRQDVEASIGLVPANSEQFVDEGVVCGNTYRYTVVAFNAAGVSPDSATAQVTLPPCTSADTPPTLVLTVVPTQVQVSETFTISFEANDDLGMALVIVWGEKTGNPTLDAGRVFTCTETICAGNWPLTWTKEISATLTLVAIARDSAGQESEPAQTTVVIRPSE